MEMEMALNLPADMTWISEPLPSLPELNNTEEIIFFEDEFANEISVGDFVKPNPSMEFEITAADYVDFEEILNLQQQLNESDTDSTVTSLAELSSDQWIDQPINGPLNEYSPIRTTPIPVQDKTFQLLNEFNCIYNTLDSSNLTTPPTPPQTPPETSHNSVHLDDSPENQFNYYPQPVANNICNYQFAQCNQPLTNHQNVTMPIQQNANGFTLFEQAVHLVQDSVLYPDAIKSVTDADAAKIVAEVEEFVRLQAEGYDDECTSTSGASSCSSSFASNTDAGSSNTDDSDWNPSAFAQNGQSIGAVGAALKAKQPAKRKPRSNRRTKEDRQIRKKEQNKNAANRYRMKKKAEIEILCDEERELQKHNDSLQIRVTDISREVKCLKSLLRELFRQKGLIN